MKNYEISIGRMLVIAAFSEQDAINRVNELLKDHDIRNFIFDGISVSRPVELKNDDDEAQYTENAANDLAF
jgi:predicted DNA-binding protein with PD1-like motif